MRFRLKKRPLASYFHTAQQPPGKRAAWMVCLGCALAMSGAVFGAAELTVELANGDRITGEPLSGASGVIGLRTSYGTLRIQPAQVTRLIAEPGLAPGPDEPAPMGQTRVFFKNGDRFTGVLRLADANGLTLEGTFELVRLPHQLIERVELTTRPRIEFRLRTSSAGDAYCTGISPDALRIQQGEDETDVPWSSLDYAVFPLPVEKN
jgi:hypothetical protein